MRFEIIQIVLAAAAMPIIVGLLIRSQPLEAFKEVKPSTEKQCGKCNAVVSAAARAGMSCPHCGAYWSAENDKRPPVRDTPALRRSRRKFSSIANALLVGVVCTAVASYWVYQIYQRRVSRNVFGCVAIRRTDTTNRVDDILASGETFIADYVSIPNEFDEPVASKTITFRSAGGTIYETTTDADGDFELNLPPGVYRVSLGSLADEQSLQKYASPSRTPLDVKIWGGKDQILNITFGLYSKQPETIEDDAIVCE